MRAVYHYPQAEFPYARLREENGRRSRNEPEFELEDTGLFAGDRYFEVAVEYAKGGPNDILIEITAWNCGPERAPLHLLPTLWFRNNWSWGSKNEGSDLKPRMQQLAPGHVQTHHETLGRFFWEIEGAPGPARSAALHGELNQCRPALRGGECRAFREGRLP